MVKELQERLMDNFNEKNIENVGKLIEEQMPEKVGVMFVNEDGSGVDIKTCPSRYFSIFS